MKRNKSIKAICVGLLVLVMTMANIGPALAYDVMPLYDNCNISCLRNGR